MSARQTAKDLVAMAADSRTPATERANAAAKAVELIYEHDLLTSPFDGILPVSEDKIRAARDVIDTFANPDLVHSLKTLFSGRDEGGGARRSKKRRYRK